MHTNKFPVPAAQLVSAAAIAVVGFVATASPTAAGEVQAQNEQVALYNDTRDQAGGESELNGTAQVTSSDGTFVVFSTAEPLVSWDTNGVDDVYLRDTTDGITVLVSCRSGRPGNDYSYEPTISRNGRYVAFTTWATNLTKDTNGNVLDVVVKDMQIDALRRVSVTSQERQRDKNSLFPVISGNGHFVSFQSFGRFRPTDQDSDEDVYVRDLRKGTTRHVSVTPRNNKDIRGPVLNGDVSDDGNLVTFGNSNALWV